MSERSPHSPSAGLPGHVHRRVQMVLLGLWAGWEAYNTYRGVQLGGPLAFHLALPALVGWFIVRYFQHRGGARPFRLTVIVIDAIALTVIGGAVNAWLIRRHADAELVNIALKAMLSPAIGWAAVALGLRDREHGPAWALAVLPGAFVVAHSFLNAARGLAAQ